MRKLVIPGILLLFLVLCVHAAVGANVTGHTVYGNNHVFMVTPPKGWVLDTRCGVQQGLFAVFYPMGLSWDSSSTLIYVNASEREYSEAISSFMKREISRLREHSPYIEVEEGEPIVTQDGKIAEVRCFSNDRYGNSEAVAYIPEDNVFALIVLASRNKEAFDAAKPAFEEIVKSYFFVSNE